MQYVPKVRHIKTQSLSFKSVTGKEGDCFFVIDCREKKIIDAASKLRDVNPIRVLPFMTAQLTYGDIHVYQIDKAGNSKILAIVERKTYSDFVSSIKDNRMENLWSMSEFSHENNCFPILIIENIKKLYPCAPIFDKHSLTCKSDVDGVNDLAIRMKVGSCVITYNIKLLPSASQMDTIIQLSQLCRNKTLTGKKTHTQHRLEHTKKPLEEINLQSIKTSDGWEITKIKAPNKNNKRFNYHKQLVCVLKKFMEFNELGRPVSDFSVQHATFDKNTTLHEEHQGPANVIFYNKRFNTFSIKVVHINHTIAILQGKQYHIRKINLETDFQRLDVLGNSSCLVYILNNHIGWTYLFESISMLEHSPAPDLLWIYEDFCKQYMVDRCLAFDASFYTRAGKIVRDITQSRTPVNPDSALEFIITQVPVLTYNEGPAKRYIKRNCHHAAACLNNYYRAEPNITKKALYIYRLMLDIIEHKCARLESNQEKDNYTDLFTSDDISPCVCV